jgi:hypothetical protein
MKTTPLECTVCETRGCNACKIDPTLETGDRVDARGCHGRGYNRGTVIYTNSSYVGVEHDDDVRGHTGDKGNGKSGHCWNHNWNEVKRAKE